MSHSRDLRQRALKYVEQGGSIKEACKLFEVSRSSFQRWRNLKNTTGSLSPKSRIKSPYKIDNEALKSYINEHPDAYLNEMAAHFCVTAPCISIRLKQLKITRKKKSIFYKERDAVKRVTFLSELEKHNPEKLVYIDESGIDKFISREYGWGQKGSKVIGEISGRHYARESFIAGQLQNEIIAPFCYTGTCDRILFNFWLENCLLLSLGSGYTLIMDNATFHKSEDTKILVKNAGCELLFLPPYSPDLNPIEKFWANLKAKIKKIIGKFATLSEAIDAALTSDHLNFN